VVFSIDTDEYTDEFPKAHWEYLTRGVMIDFTKSGLTYIEEDAPDLALIRRARA